MIKQLLTALIFTLFSTTVFSQLFTTDVIVQGSMQIGGNAQNGHSFGFDTFVMSEDNLRMYFDDTSGSASFPSNDWRFTFNDSSNGGDNYFAVDDATGNKTPFRIDAGAPNNAFRIADNGNIGIGTNSPGGIELNILDNDTPTIRLGQNGGFGTQAWDVAGNEANFFVRDVTNGSKLPFRIQPKTPQNTLTLRASGTVGIGTWGPNSNASIHMSSTSKGLLINRMTTDQRTTFAASLGTGENGMMVYDNEENKVYTWNGTTWVTDTDAQDLDLTDNTLSLTNDGTTVDLSKYLDNTDNQAIDAFQLNGNNLELSLENDGVATKTVDLSGYLDNTDTQDLNLTNNTLSLTNDGTTVDLAKYLDNTDNQDLDLSGNTLSLTNDGTTVDLSGYLDNTDAQMLNLTNGNLSISNGNTVDLSALINTDNQSLTSASLNNTDLTIEIENGASVTVDLAPIVTPLETDLVNAQQEIADLVSENQSQQTQIDDLLRRLEALEQNIVSQTPLNKSNTPILYQNIPNPFNGTAIIKYYLPEGITNASIVFSDMVGKVFSTIALKQTGDGELYINSDGLSSGTYFYTLYAGSRKIDTKKMVIE
ncbi:T9SS type A sorting domain-containing protein [Aquimarina mytili]|uniref:T9SS type A sorting domain-containing protein n=1 Tax=Aquimarina mytili TaxID=874423 RepID=A0A937A2T7_9FLAO|nr:T9SS type A sorting domain-containing protein [Aquimarina mytili]MBL0683930.1 T9SS type A sorting domain-containing protein [Aquimarina mytili]